ncbi:ThuA domain-containing protein [Antarcticibacterium sp. 1MA-6-2]|uniref:ThuA domain-containing protein n=1 Tax=Antarcticibacterium sp. 1MA-6-2 TaxID=2908210 RepID=UPI001F4310C5|nr:ThuA domain-containing protein [Antarcticibacterium sp. 1MA-6-2]UJH90009.1 ThuA domain-containing protein [Antarcticibacterium sp. 1MA-6-2]
MKTILNFLMCCFLFAILPIQAQDQQVLVFHKTVGFWHESIPAGYQAIQDLGEDNGFAVVVTDKADTFNEEELETFDLVIFLNTTGNVLDEKQQEAFKNYINEGGNFFGIHAAADTEYDWEWYGQLVGAYFNGHPENQWAEVNVVMSEHPTVKHLPHTWRRHDEWYNYKNINPEMQVLMKLDESTYKGGTNGDDHPIAWYKELEGGGKTIYT